MFIMGLLLIDSKCRASLESGIMIQSRKKQEGFQFSKASGHD